MTALPSFLRQRRALTPSRLALVADGERLTFAELDERVERLARELSRVAPGTGRRERVGLLLGNGLPFVLLTHAVWRLGAVLVPLNVRLAHGELEWQVRDAGLCLVVCDAADEPLAREAAGTLCPVVSADALLDGGQSGPPPEEAAVRDQVDLDDPACVIYTSGTTGRPKGAILTFGNLWWSAIGSALNLGLRDDDCWLGVLPLFHVGGLSILVRSVVYGIPALVHRRFDAAEVNRAIDEQGVTIASVVSTMLQRLLDARGDRPYPPGFRCFLLGGGPAPRPLLEACARIGAPVVQTYGLTETSSQIATLAPEDALRKLGSAGKPLFPNELRVVREGSALPAHEVGEIQVRGPSITPGYHNRPEASARALCDGWLHTGDLGYLDDEGYLYVVDRRDDLIVSGGENVYPAEVEAVLLAHPGVADAGAYPVAHATWGQAVAAAVQPRAGCALEADDLRAFCRERLAAYKVPLTVRFVDRLPRNAAGKLQRARLRES